MRKLETRGARRPAIIDRPRVAWEGDARGRRTPVSPLDKAALRPVRFAALLDALAYLVFVLIQVYPGPPGTALWLTYPFVGVWVVADVAAWDGGRGGLKARAALGGVLLLVALGPVVRGGLVLGAANRYGAEEDWRVVWWCVGALVVGALGTATCLNALQRVRLAASPAPPAGDAWSLPSPHAREVALHPARRAPPARTPSRAARAIGAFGVLWMVDGAVESLRGNFWFGLVEVAIGVGWLMCHDTLLDRRTDLRLVPTDRSSLLPVLLIPVGGVALLVRAAWLLGFL